MDADEGIVVTMQNRVGLFVIRLVLLLAGSLSAVQSAAAQSAENVAVVINDASPASQQIGEYYARKRVIPASNIFHIRTAATEAIDYPAFVGSIQAPLAAALSRAGLQDRILYIVLTKGVPLKINGTSGITGTGASVDSELTLLYRRLAGRNVSTAGRIDNPYFLGAAGPADAKRFSRHDQDIYLVSRLDAFTVDEVIALIDRGVAPSTEGRVVLDQRDRLVDRTGEEWLAAAGTRLTAAGQGSRVLLETTVAPVRDVAPVLGYYSWGSNDPRNLTRKAGLGFAAGALAAAYVASDARTFSEPPAGWTPTADADQQKWFGGSGQSLVGDLIREGATGASGSVAEPFFQSMVRPDILFPAYFSGFNLVESFYLAIPHLSWQTVVIGDPLCAPLTRPAVAKADIEEAVDPQTTLPGFLSKRRIERTATTLPPNAPAQTAALVVRSEALLGRNDVPGATQALIEVVRLTPSYLPSQLQLSLLYEQAGQHDAAIEGYRRVLQIDPRQGVALNNLAFALATRKNQPKEALPFAQRAVAVSPQSATVIDTLAWIEHLLGDDAAAAKRMAPVVRAAPNNPELRLHAAIIYAATGARAVAENELAAALKLDPALESSAQVQTLRSQLQKLPSAK